jgi:hypothetical protein
MVDLIGKLASAISTAEGFWVDGSLPARDNNPGDLRQAPWLHNPTLQHGFWVAPSKQAGIAGLMHQIALDIARGWTLRKLIETYAPPSDGNATENYLKETCRRVGLPYYPPEQSTQELPLWDYLEITEIK